MKIVIDMNLSPEWVSVFETASYEAVHFAFKHFYERIQGIRVIALCLLKLSTLLKSLTFSPQTIHDRTGIADHHLYIAICLP